MRLPRTIAVILLTLCCFATAFSQERKGAEARAARTRLKALETRTHDAGSYTQGLFFHDGKLYESAGQYGESSLRIVDPSSGRVLKRKNFARRYFLEGSCVLDGVLYVLSWREGTAFALDAETLAELGTFRYRGEGWGLTTDGKSLIMSDGSSTLKWISPGTFQTEKEIAVTLDGKPLRMLNELEYIDGFIWANVYGSDAIARIDPADGRVKELFDCRGLLAPNLRKPSTDVLNGIAFDPATGGVWLTGKYWPRMFRVK